MSKDLASLHCTQGVPDDGVERYLCTSPEFAKLLTSKDRKWHEKPYRYELIELTDEAETRLLYLLPS